MIMPERLDTGGEMAVLVHVSGVLHQPAGPNRPNTAIKQEKTMSTARSISRILIALFLFSTVARDQNANEYRIIAIDAIAPTDPTLPRDQEAYARADFVYQPNSTLRPGTICAGLQSIQTLVGSDDAPETGDLIGAGISVFQIPTVKQTKNRAGSL
jgi:hypothetical protein